MVDQNSCSLYSVIFNLLDNKGETEFSYHFLA
jgi:hypothetical protein